MDKLVIEHKELRKYGWLYLLVAVVLSAVLIVAGDQFVLSVGTVILLLAIALELGMGIYTLIEAESREEFDETGVTAINLFRSKHYPWSSLKRFEINWHYERGKKKGDEEPFILLKFESPRKTMKFSYDQDVDRCIRCNYGAPHLDNWTNVGK